MRAKVKMPFEYGGTNGFHEKLIEWIGDVLYDILPEHEYEVRDEQIFTAFQIADAFRDKKVHLAEAGLGTGKTFAYLLSAIPYARYTGKPVVISCASPALQEQLAAETGDINKLSKLLGLEVDARMAKDPRQYICDVHASASLEEAGELSEEIHQWLGKTRRGERSEIPTIPDRVWKKIAWNDSMSCDVCVNRGYCKLVRAREHYRAAVDLIIVDHETFFQDLWTREEKIESGHMPILPNYSAVIFDEGHKIMLPAAMQAGEQLIKEEMEAIIASLEDIQGARNALHTATATLEEATTGFFKVLEKSAVAGEAEGRLSVEVDMSLLGAARSLRASLDQLLIELQIEQELYLESMPIPLIQAYEGQIEGAMRGLTQLCKTEGEDVVAWVDQRDGSFFVVPRNLTMMLNKALYKKSLPVIFSSATLSNEGDFTYFIRTMGLKSPSHATIGSPFNMEEQVTISFASADALDRIDQLVAMLKENGGRALVLTRSLREVRQMRQQLKGYELPFEVLYEDEGDRGYLVRRFKEEETAVLVGSDFWEGIDVPGDALTLVVIWQLPFPELDPLIEAQRKDAKEQGLDPVQTVDYPAMGLKLKQGCGRLIRTEEDRGKIVFMDEVLGTPWESIVLGALPKDATIE
ncbi:MAG: ATP-dependent DNA helicase [Cellulosilyticaceae bacterium]